MLVLALAGCTSQAAVSAPSAPSGARPGGVLRVGITPPGSLDPGNDYEPMSDLVLRTMCDPLIAADPETGRLRPALAQSWVVSDNGGRLVIRLRKGLTFSDGSPVTADDVAYSFSRIASAEYASSAAGQLEPVLGYPEVHGDKETDNDTDRQRLAGVVPLDRQSVEITLAYRKADFIRLLTSPLVSPVPRSGRRLCSGPYALAKGYRPGDRLIRLERVHGRKAVDSSLTRSGAGYPDRIEFHVFATAGLAAQAQRDGLVDVAPAQPKDQVGVQSGPGPMVELLGFPTSSGPLFDKVEVRRALALALDREALVRQVFPGSRTVATGFLPPTDRPDFHAEACDLPARGDLPAARQLLAHAGADLKGQQTRIYVNADGRNVQLARAVAAQWQRALGLRVSVTPLDFEAYLDRGSSAKGFDAPFRFSWSTPYADADGFLFPLFSSDRIGRDNFSRFSDPAVDRALVRQARETEHEDDRLLEHRRVEQLLCDQLPMVPLTFSLSRWLVDERFATASSYLDGTTGQPLLRELYVSARTP
jgi:ABC-type transport system substrate-binding protein